MQRNVTKMSDAELDTEHASLLAEINKFKETLDWFLPLDSPPWMKMSVTNDRCIAISNEQWYREQVRSLDSDKMAALLLVADQPRIADEVASALRNAGMIETMTNRDDITVHMITALGRRTLGV